MMLRWQCRECGWHGNEDAIARVKDPESDVVWNVCPQCRAADQFDNLCDEPGCDALAGCGWPSDKGYRRTCFKHSKWAGEVT